MLEIRASALRFSTFSIMSFMESMNEAVASRKSFSLMAAPVSDHVKNAALMHHERCDGSGYPLKLTGAQIDPSISGRGFGYNRESIRR
mgnify:CR=1 FL=1